MEISDTDGTVEQLADDAVELSIEGPATLAGFGSAVSSLTHPVNPATATAAADPVGERDGRGKRGGSRGSVER